MLTAVVADEHGNIFELDGYAAAGMSGNDFFILTKSDTCCMPHGSELMLLPDRAPIVFNLFTDRFETLETNPFQPDQRIFPITYNAARVMVNKADLVRKSEYVWEVPTSYRSDMKVPARIFTSAKMLEMTLKKSNLITTIKKRQFID